MKSQTANIAGYAYGKKEVAKSPVTLEEIEQLKKTVRSAGAHT